MSLLLILNVFHTFSSVSIVDFDLIMYLLAGEQLWIAIFLDALFWSNGVYKELGLKSLKHETTEVSVKLIVTNRQSDISQIFFISFIKNFCLSHLVYQRPFFIYNTLKWCKYQTDISRGSTSSIVKHFQF